jgi:hypothetical protein
MRLCLGKITLSTHCLLLKFRNASYWDLRVEEMYDDIHFV